MKSLWITLFLFATCTASGNSPSLTQTPENLYQKGADRTENKEDVEAKQRRETNTPKYNNEVVLARERLNGLRWKQSHLDRIETTLARRRTTAITYLGKEDSTTHYLISGETLILTKGTQPFLHNVLQFLKTAGKTLIAGGILTILLIIILLMLIIYLRTSYTNKREWKLIL